MAVIAHQATLKKNPTVAADLVVLTMAAGTTGAGDTIDITGRTIIIAQNTDASVAYDIVITSAAGSEGRTVVITKELTAGQIVPICVGGVGWQNASGRLAVSVENAAIKWGAFVDPRG